MLATLVHAFNSSGDTGVDKFGKSPWLREGVVTMVQLCGLLGQCFKLKFMCILFIRRLFSGNDTG